MQCATANGITIINFGMGSPGAATIMLDNFDAIGRGIGLILRLTRGSTLFREFTAETGFFQRSLDPNVPCQMVRVALPAGSPYYAEISGGRHRFSVRFLRQPSTNERAVQASADRVCLQIADDGCGFDLDQGIRSGGMGLTSMLERAEALGGTLEILTAPGSGTQITLTIQEVL